MIPRAPRTKQRAATLVAARNPRFSAQRQRSGTLNASPEQFGTDSTEVARLRRHHRALTCVSYLFDGQEVEVQVETVRPKKRLSGPQPGWQAGRVRPPACWRIRGRGKCSWLREDHPPNPPLRKGGKGMVRLRRCFIPRRRILESTPPGVTPGGCPAESRRRRNSSRSATVPGHHDFLESTLVVTHRRRQVLVRLLGEVNLDLGTGQNAVMIDVDLVERDVDF